MTAVFKPAREHSYRLSVYQRRANDFYPTPSELAISLAIGLPRQDSICLELHSIHAAVTVRSAAGWRPLGSTSG